MKFILITRPDYFSGEEEVLNTLFDNGLDLLHIRKPDTPVYMMERLLSLINPKYYKKIVVHDYFDLQKEFGLLGVHLNSRSKTLPEGYEGQVSMSCHSLEEVAGHKSGCDYVFLSPVYDSVSKAGYKSAFTKSQLKAAGSIIDRKVIALGGITVDNIKEVKSLGFGGVAMIGGLWDKFDELKDISFDPLIEHFKKIKSLL